MSVSSYSGLLQDLLQWYTGALWRKFISSCVMSRVGPRKPHAPLQRTPVLLPLASYVSGKNFRSKTELQVFGWFRSQICHDSKTKPPFLWSTLKISKSAWAAGRNVASRAVVRTVDFMMLKFLQMANRAILLEWYLQQEAKLAAVFMSGHSESRSITSPIVFWRHFFSGKEKKVISRYFNSIRKERRGLSRGRSYGECQPGSLHLHEHHVTIPEGWRIHKS